MAQPSRLTDLLPLTLCALVLFGQGLTERTLRRPAEGRVARVAQEILDSGEWVVPQLNGKPRVKKPPLSSWLVAGTALLGGSSRVTTAHALLPSAVAAALLLLVACLWVAGPAREDAGDAHMEANAMRLGGLAAALSLALMPALLGQARAAEMDMLLALFVFTAFWSWERHQAESSTGALLGFYLSLALGFLTKGHVILVMVLPALVAWHLLKRGAPRPPAQPALPREPHQPGGRSSWVGHGLGLLLFLALVLGWGIPFLQRSTLTWTDFTREGVERFGASTGHQEPFYFYLANIPAWALPCFLLLPILAWLDWRGCLAHRSRRLLWWLWFGCNLVFWSVLSAKQRHYAVPWLPPLALLAGDGLAQLVFGPAGWSASGGREPAPAPGGVGPVGSALPEAAVRWFLWIAAAQPFALAAALAGFAGYWQFRQAPLGAGWILAGGGVAAFLGAGLRLRSGFSAVVLWLGWAGLLCGSALFGVTAERSADAAASPRAFCERVRRAVPDTSTLYDTGVASEDAQVLFYLGRNVEPVEVQPPRTQEGAVLSRHEREAWETRAQATLLSELARRSQGPLYVLAYRKVREALPAGLFEEAIPGESGFGGHQVSVHLLRSRGRGPGLPSPAGPK